MRWVTREKAKVDRIACPWLIRKFVTPKPNSFSCPTTPIGPPSLTEWFSTVPDAELGHHHEYCSFDAIIARYGLEKDPTLVELAKIVRAADTPRKDWSPEGIGLEAIADGFRRISAD